MKIKVNAMDLCLALLFIALVIAVLLPFEMCGMEITESNKTCYYSYSYFHIAIGIVGIIIGVIDAWVYRKKEVS